MSFQRVAIVLSAGLLSVILLGAQTAVGVIRSRPFPTPQEIANLELHVLQDQEDLEARRELLQVYLDTAPPPGAVDVGRRSVRLQHILYLVEHHPEAAVSGSALAYVYRVHGPYANEADHAIVLARWIGAVQRHPGVNAVVLNAAKFLETEDTEDAERLLRQSADADPANRELAASLGFLYAKEILGSVLAAHAAAELEQTSDAVVLAAAGTALPNLAVKSGYAIPGEQKIFDLANELGARARQLAPGDSDIQGPMPFIRYFASAQDGSSLLLPGQLPTAAGMPPVRIKVGQNVQAANLIRRTQPQYPEEARQAGIAGAVQLSVIVGRDGTIQNVALVSGHPLLAGAAMESVKSWIYKPTFLNGQPVEVVTTVTVMFPPN